jgi:putative flippase GtrA
MSAAGTTGGARQFWAFLLVGGLAAVVNWFSRIMISAQGVPFEAAVVVAYLLGMVTAYLLSRMFVFEKTGRSVANEVTRFTLVNMVALVVVWVVSVTLERWLLPAINWTWRPAEVAHAVGVLSPVVTSYLGHRYFTFGQTRSRSEGADGDSTAGDRQA